MQGVSFVVPVYNGAAHLADTLASIAAQADGRPMEVIVVEDGSRDASADVLRAVAASQPLIVLDGPRRGAAAAVNCGVRRASHPFIGQVDQDVVLEPGWMTRLMAALDEADVAAAQGCYVADGSGSLCARAMALDLEQRYARLGSRTTHVCTGNTVYRTEALRAVGGLDESLGYGYDNDVSYRLQASGYRLAFCREARSRHRWRDGVAGYLSQQYGFGYGRLDVVAKHPRRCTGDAVSPPAMMFHPIATASGLALVAAGAPAGGLVLAVLAVERLAAGVRAWARSGDRAGLVFPVAHFLRDIAWIAAAGVWIGRRLLGRPRVPAHSMTGRRAAT